MEFAKDIYFDNSLTAGKEAKITYSGYLFKNGSSNVNIVYGFGNAWNDTTSTPMNKEDNGFVANIQIKDYDSFNFCFSDENNNWDNNYNSNYIAPIQPEIKEDSNSEINFGTDYSSSIDEIIEDILGNTTKQDIISEKDSNSVDKILESITEETMPEIEALFNDLFFESVKEDEKDNSPIQEISMEPELAEELKELGKDVENAPVNTIVTSELEVPEFDNTELIRQFNELFEESEKTISFDIIDESPIEEPVQETEFVEQKLNVANFDLDNLVANILEPVITSENPVEKAEEASLFEDINAQEEERENSLAVINSGEFTVGSRKLGYFYKLKKRIRLAFIKLSKAKKDFLEQLGL